jgi:hypothetical protein
VTTTRPSKVIKTDEEIRLAAEKRMKGKKGQISKAAANDLEMREAARAVAQANYERFLGQRGRS